MANQQTGDTRTTAKNKFGIQGISPVDPALGEIHDQSDFTLTLSEAAAVRGATEFQGKGLVIAVAGGTFVRATHPGRVRRIEKVGRETFNVEVSATQGVLTQQTARATAFTKYKSLGTVDVVEGEIVSAGQQLGTVSFKSSGGQTSLIYETFINGTGTKASEAAPDSDIGRRIVAQANPQGQPPDKTTQLRVPPPEGEDSLNKEEPDTSSVEDLPTEGERVSNADQISYSPQVRFAEQKNQVFSHDFLVFINGVDVTKYVVGSLSVNLVDKDGFNEANFELNNTHDNFVVTNNNLGINASLTPIFRSSDITGENKYSERAKKEILEYKNDEKRNPFVDIETMTVAKVTTGVADSNVLGREQQAAGTEVRDQAESSRQIALRDSLKKPAGKLVDRRWHIGHQSTVFHKNDPIRIFRKNPLREADEWMPAFTGYLSQISYNTNYVNGYSTVKLACYDIRWMIQKMRVQLTAVTGFTNPKALFLSSEKGSKSLFTDLINPVFLGHPLANKRFEDVMEFLITGTSEQDPAIRDRFAASEYVRGVGEFTVGDRIYYKSGKRADGIDPDPLEHWHALCLFGMDGQTRVTGNDSTTTSGGTAKKVLGTPFNRRWLTEAEARKIGKLTTHDGEWAPHSQFLHFLLPAEGTGARNLLDFDAVNANSNQLDFRSRLDIMQDFCNRIDYQFWVTPIGDIVVEFPMYDFRPDDYGEFKSVFQVDKHLRSDNIEDEAGEMVTAIVAHGALTPLKGVGPKEQFQPKAIVVAPMMMMRYGVNEQELTLPFVGDPNALRRLAKIEFLKRLSESNKMDMDFDYRPFILPNRPLENVERKRMGLTTAINNTVEVFQTGSTSVTTRYIRRQILNQDRKTVSYTFIFGGESAPITYREIFGEGAGQIAGNLEPGKAALLLDVRSIGESNSADLLATEARQTAENVDKVAATKQIIGNPPPTEQTSRFVALAQQLSGFNPFNRDATTGGFGLFSLLPDVRGIANGGFGIGDTTDIAAQLSAADQYYRGLISKHKGDLDTAISEFVLGAKKLKNADIVGEFKKGFLAANKELGKEFETLAQPLIDGFNKLFPGEKDPVDTQVATQSEASKEAEEAAAANPGKPDRGSQATVGVLAFDNRGDLATLQNKRNLAAAQAEAAQKQAAPSGFTGPTIGPTGPASG